MTASSRTPARRILEIGASPSDSDEMRVAKEIFVALDLAAMTAGLVWAVMYTILGRPLSGLIPFSATILVAIRLVQLAATKRLGSVAIPILPMMIVLPLLLQLSLGGYVYGSAVVVWAFVAPLAAMVLRPIRETPIWLALFFADLAIAGVLDPVVAQSVTPLGPAVRGALFGLNFAGVATLAFVALFVFRSQREIAERRSEQLLLNVLPEQIASRLKRGEEPIADHFDGVTVLFADLAGFTARSVGETPKETIAVLNEVFSAFDELARRYGLEKIRTIGDSYMVAAGVPVARADHVEAMCSMAIDLQREVARLNSERGWDLHFRVGINCGPAVAGIVGKQKFHYDVWGDTVNVASRMESHGVPDQIQVTEAVYDRAKTDYMFECRGSIDVKGKGPTVTYLLLGRKGVAGIVENASFEAAGQQRSPAM